MLPPYEFFQQFFSYITIIFKRLYLFIIILQNIFMYFKVYKEASLLSSLVTKINLFFIVQHSNVFKTLFQLLYYSILHFNSLQFFHLGLLLSIPIILPWLIFDSWVYDKFIQKLNILVYKTILSDFISFLLFKPQKWETVKINLGSFPPSMYQLFVVFIVL